MTFRELLNIIYANKKIILRLSIPSILIFFLILYFVYPLSYSSPVKILPPEGNNYQLHTSQLLNSGLSDFINYPLTGTNSQLYAEIIKSRSAAEYVIKKCRLVDYLNSDNIHQAAQRLDRLLNVDVSKEGIITVSVDIKTSLFGRFNSSNEYAKNLSAEVSNTFAEALDIINREKLNSRAKNVSLYLQQQIKETKFYLDSSEASLKSFQEKNKTISIDEQLTTSIETAAKLKSEIILTEVQLGTLGKNLQANSSVIEGLTTKLAQLKKQYSEIEAGGKLDNDYFPQFSRIPKTSLELARLMREVRIQNEVYLMLQRQLYSEKLQERKDVPTIEILDDAIPPLEAKSPRLVVHTILGTIAILLLISLLIILQERKRTASISMNESKSL